MENEPFETASEAAETVSALRLRCRLFQSLRWRVLDRWTRYESRRQLSVESGHFRSRGVDFGEDLSASNWRAACANSSD